jgi:hypothetical protein
MRPIHWLIAGVCSVTALVTIAALLLNVAEQIGLSNAERGLLVTAINNVTTSSTTCSDNQAIVANLNATLNQNTSVVIAQQRNIYVPQVTACQLSVAANVPILALEVARVGAIVVDTSLLDAIQPQIDTTSAALTVLATTFQNSGVVTTIQSGTVTISNEFVPSDSVSSVYHLKKMILAGLTFYFVNIPAPSPDLYITNASITTPAAIVFSGWSPAILVPSAIAGRVDTILDAQRQKIQVAPTLVLFDRREYDASTGAITLRSLNHYFTPGDLLRITDDLEMNVGFV